MNKRILHVDADAFFASVEVAKNPALLGKPIIVGAVSSKRGVVSTASYEARRFGVKSGMAISQAKKLCPNGIFIDGEWKSYKDYSDEMFSIFEKYTPYITQTSIDEAYLNITESIALFNGEKNLAINLKESVKDRLNITVSVGIGGSNVVAKIASSIVKPDGLTIVPPNSEKEFLKDLSVDEIPGVGKKSKLALEENGIIKIGDMYKYSKLELIELFGAFGNYLWNAINLVEGERYDSTKSISKEKTFEEDTIDINEISKELMDLTEDVGFRLRREGLEAKTVFIKVRYADFKTITRRKTFKIGLYDDVAIYREALELLKSEIISPIRLIGVGVSNLEKQNILFTHEEDKNIKFLKAIDTIKSNFGTTKIKRMKGL
jgi:DNA polymerase-4